MSGQHKYKISALAREPLAHFLVIGALLFLLSSWRGNSPRSATVVVDKGKIENIVAQFKRTWQRSPTEKELDGLIEQAVKDEIYYREAVAQGMDQDDIVIRRHLRQKLEIVA